jgi:dCTP deaminase
MILSDSEIMKRLSSGDLTITPFNPSNLNPNSYDLTLAPKLLMYSDPILDVKSKATTYSIDIPDGGLVLKPGEVYIGSVNEHTSAPDLVGVVYGKSSLGRLGLVPHVCAGFVDNGYSGKLTLELAVIRPIRIYANMRICQIAYSTIKGELSFYQGKYQNAVGPEASKSHKDFKNG